MLQERVEAILKEKEIQFSYDYYGRFYRVVKKDRGAATIFLVEEGGVARVSKVKVGT